MNKACVNNNKTLNIFLQVLSSEEDTKSGIKPSEAMELVDTIMNEYKNLKLIGLMSIGKLGDLEGFELMYKLKCDICEKYNIDKDKFELSIGTSADYEDAIKVGGATEVRVGTQIFGKRTDKNINTSSEEEEEREKQKEKEGED